MLLCHFGSLTVPLCSWLSHCASLSLFLALSLSLSHPCFTLPHSHTILITCTCCYDLTKGAQDKDFSYSFFDSLSLWLPQYGSLDMAPLLWLSQYSSGQVAVYMEAGAVPALLDHLVLIFDLSYSQQGLLGGSVYLALAAACPIAGDCVLTLLC